MLQKRLFKSSVSISKKINRRARIGADQLKSRFRKIVPLLIIIPLVVLLNNLFTVKKINCVLNDGVCPQEIHTVLNNIQGSNSLLINQKELLTFIKAIFPVDEMSLNYHALNTLNVNLKGTSPYISANVYLVSQLPVLSMDQAPSTTDSASWWVKPSGELEDFVLNKDSQGFNLWENGTMTSIATSSANISFIFSEKPFPETITSIYKVISLANKYLDLSSIFIVNNRCFLSRSGQPDIIVSVPFDEGSLAPALQSISYLATIKKDAKVIDLSFKNPIIR